MAYLLINAAKLLAGGSLVLFIAFLYTGPLHMVELGLNDTGTLLLNTMLCLVFFVQHSWMIRKSFRQKLTDYISSPYHGAVYAVCSGLTLLLVITLWQESAQVLLRLEAPISWLPRLLFLLSTAGLVWCARSLTSFDLVGKRQIMAHLNKKRMAGVSFTIRGPYHFVRHPFYFLILVMIWSCPDVTLDRLLFNCLWSLWIAVGTVLEERDLVIEFSTQYRDYQQKVPMLIPWRAGWKDVATVSQCQSSGQ